MTKSLYLCSEQTAMPSIQKNTPYQIGGIFSLCFFDFLPNMLYDMDNKHQEYTTSQDRKQSNKSLEETTFNRFFPLCEVHN